MLYTPRCLSIVIISILQEEAILKEIIEESLKEKLKQQEKDHAETKTQNEAPKDTTNDLLDFFSDPTPPANPSFQSVAM